MPPEALCLVRDGPMIKLTARQKVIISLIASGLTSEEIAARLSITRSGVSAHRDKILDNIGGDSLLDMVAYAIAEDLVPPDSVIGMAVALRLSLRSPAKR